MDTELMDTVENTQDNYEDTGLNIDAMSANEEDNELDIDKSASLIPEMNDLLQEYEELKAQEGFFTEEDIDELDELATKLKYTSDYEERKKLIEEIENSLEAYKGYSEIDYDEEEMEEIKQEESDRIRERCDFILGRYDTLKKQGFFTDKEIVELDELADKLHDNQDKNEMFDLYKNLKSKIHKYLFAEDKVEYTEDRDYTRTPEKKKPNAIKLKDSDEKKFDKFREKRKKKKLQKIQKQKEKYEKQIAGYREKFGEVGAIRKDVYEQRLASLQENVRYLDTHYDNVYKSKPFYYKAIVILSKPMAKLYAFADWLKFKFGIVKNSEVDVKKVSEDNGENIMDEVEEGFNNIENENETENSQDNGMQNVDENNEMTPAYDNDNTENTSEDEQVENEDTIENDFTGSDDSNNTPVSDDDNEQQIENQEDSVDDIIQSIISEDAQETDNIENSMTSSNEDAMTTPTTSSSVTNDDSNNNVYTSLNPRTDVQVTPQRTVLDEQVLTHAELPKVTSENLKGMLDDYLNEYSNSTSNEYGMGLDLEYEPDKEEIGAAAKEAYGRYQEKENDIQRRVDELYKTQVPEGVILSDEQEKRLKEMLRKQVEKEDAVAESKKKEEEKREQEEAMQRKVEEANEQFTNKYLESIEKNLQQLDKKKNKYDDAAVKSSNQQDALEAQLRLLTNKTNELDEMLNESTNESGESHSMTM